MHLLAGKYIPIKKQSARRDALHNSGPRPSGARRIGEVVATPDAVRKSAARGQLR
jgi:hypothetical protein